MTGLFLVLSMLFIFPGAINGESEEAVNLALGKSVTIETPYAHFDGFQGIGNYDNESDESQTWKLTNGHYGNTENWGDFSDWFVFYRKQKREVIVDLEDVNTVNSLSIGFGQTDEVGIVPPINVRYSVSNDGVDYRYLGKAEPDVPLYYSSGSGDSIHRKVYELTELQDGTPLNVQARYVKLEFTIATFGWADEIEIIGQQGIVNGAELPESQPDDYEYDQFAEPGTVDSAEITDQFIWYSGPMENEYFTDWTKDKVMSFLGYIGVDGEIDDWFFDDLLAMPVVAMLTPSGLDGNGGAIYKTTEDMNAYLDFIFKDDTQFGAINEAVGELNELLGTDKKVRINMAIPDITASSNFGDITGDGDTFSLIPADFADMVDDPDSHEGQQEMHRLALENKKRAVEWYINEVEQRFQAAGYDNLNLNSFYWTPERLYEENGDVQLIQATAEYLKNKSYFFTWIPYLGLNQAYVWRDLGFTTGAIQPNFAFNNSKKAVFPAISELAKKLGSSIEIEYDDFRTLTQYLNAGYKEGFMTESYNTYYMAAMPIAEGAYAFTPFDNDKHDATAAIRRSVYDRMYEYAKGTYVPRYTMNLLSNLDEMTDISAQIMLPLADAFVSGQFTVHYDHKTVQYDDIKLPEELEGKGNFNVDSSTPGVLKIDFELFNEDDAIFGDLQERRNPLKGAPELLTLKFSKLEGVDDKEVNERDFVIDETGEMVDKDGQVYLNFTASDIIPGSLEEAISEAHQAILKIESIEDKEAAQELVQQLPDSKVKENLQEQIDAIIIMQTIRTVVDPSEITVDNGTELADLNLPETVPVAFTNGRVRNIEVVWDSGEPVFAGDIPGTYTFTGSLELPIDVENPNKLTTQIAVTVNEPIDDGGNDKPDGDAADQVVTPGETVEVGAGNIVFVKGTEPVIIMPENLPEGTTIHVTLLDEKDLEPLAGHVLVGNGIAVNLQLPDDFTGDIDNFTLIMSYDNETYNADQVDMYYFNESTKEWEKQNGDVDDAKGMISLEVPHFSTYAVFAEVDEGTEGEDPNGEDPEKDDEDPNGEGPGQDNGEDPNGEGSEKDNGKDPNHDKAGNGDKNGNGQTLPKTATSVYNWLMIGGFLLIIGIGIMLYRMRVRA